MADLYLPQGTDFTALQSVRVTIRADRDRKVQLALMSLAYSQSSMDGGWIWGWNIDATDQVQVLELPVAELAMPWWRIADGTEDPVDAIIDQVSSIRIVPFSVTTGADGLLDAPEDAFVSIDDLEFVFGP